MANLNAPSGLSPVQHRNGNPWNGMCNMYCILAADTNAYWIGDPVTTIGNANADSNGIPAVTLGVAGSAIRGVIVGIGTGDAGGTATPATLPGGPYATLPNLQQMYRPSGAQATNYYVAVVDDPDVIFEIQEGGVGSVLTATSVNRNVNFNTGTRTGSVINFPVSPTFLDNNTVNTTSTLNLKIIRAKQTPDNVPFTASQKWIVALNNHEFSGGTTGP